MRSFSPTACALVVLGMAACVAVPTDATEVTIPNSVPRLDVKTGKILELGDGSIAKFGDRYYLYGVKYICTPSPVGPTQNCAKTDRRIWGNMSIGIASSADMVTWELETYNAIPEMHENTTVYPTKEYAWFMPTIVKNDTHYALWYYIDDYARGVAVSSSPTGPFKIVHDCIPNLQLGSDFFFWTGSDGHTYMKHNSGCEGDGAIVKPGGECPKRPPKRGQGICVARLAPNMTDIAYMSPKIKAPGEGGGIFERDGTWYIMQGHGCCFCFCGDDAQVFESKTGPYGPYNPTNDLINCSKPDYTVGRNCGGPSTPERGPGAQQFGVFPIPQADNTTAYLWVGIRYGSAPDGLKCHEYQYWDALEFDVAGHAKPLHYKSNFTMNLLPPAAVPATAAAAAAATTMLTTAPSPSAPSAPSAPLAPPAPFPFCDGAESDKCKVCPPSGNRTAKKVCVMNDDKSQVQCLDCTKKENHRDCVDSECIKPDRNPCGPGKTCQGCASGMVCVGYACLDCNAQQNYKACDAAGCGLAFTY